MEVDRIGLLGGTFDPVHMGHLVAAEAVREALSLSRVIFVASGVPPHKHRPAILPVEHRLAMTRLAISDHPSFEVSEYEATAMTPSYTVDTLAHFQTEAGEDVLIHFIVGGDSILEIDTWREPERILRQYRVVVVDRPGYDLSQLDKEIASRITRVEIPLIGISSSEIRKRVSEGRSIRFLVPHPVEEYIHRNRLYAAGRAP